MRYKHSRPEQDLLQKGMVSCSHVTYRYSKLYVWRRAALWPCAGENAGDAVADYFAAVVQAL